MLNTPHFYCLCHALGMLSTAQLTTYTSLATSLAGHEFHETCHSVTFYFMKKAPNDVVTPQRQSQFTPKMKANVVPRFRVCFHLWCELTSTMNVTEWQVSWNSCYVLIWKLADFILSESQRCSTWKSKRLLKRIKKCVLPSTAQWFCRHSFV